MSNFCTDVHVCTNCGQSCSCGSYTWACPWRNDDEDKLCGACGIDLETELGYDYDDDEY